VALQCLGREASRLRAVTDVLATAEAEAMTRAGMLLTSLADPEDCLGPATSTMPHRPRDPRDAAEFDELAAAIAQVEVLRDLGDFAEGLRVAEDLPARAARIGSRGLEAEAWLWLGNLQDADARDGSEAFAQALWAAEAADRTPLAATAALALAGSETTAGNFDVARRWIEVGEALVERVGSDLTLQARVARVRGQLLHDQGQYAAALPELRQTVRIVRELYGDEDARLAPRLDDLGEVLRELGEYEAALASHGEALRVFETQVGEEHPWVATSLNKAAAVLTQQGRYEEALAHHERALAIRTGAFGDQHYAVAVSMANLGNCLIGLGRAPEAVDVLQRAVVITEATAADIQLAAPLLALAGAERMSGDIAAAEQTYARAVAQMRTSLGPDHVHVGVALANWAAAAFDNGQFERAAALAEEALQIETAGLGPDHPRTAFPLTMLGRAKLQLGEFEAAGAALQRSLEVGADRDPVDRAETRFALAEARWALGDRATARALAEQAAAEFEQGSRGLEGAHEVRTWIKRHS
jgi:tetratricopeptide (TPR) repeat protein